MKITVQIAVESTPGQPELIQQVAQLERGPSLRPDTLGLSLTEARSILAGLEQTIVERQCAEWVALEQRCPRCGQLRTCKGHHAIVLRTPFGKLKLDSPRLYRCPCESPALKSFSPLAELLPERTSPELAYLETKFAALVSYGLSVQLLQEVLPIGTPLNTMSLRRQVRHTAGRLETELAHKPEGFAAAVPPIKTRNPSWRPPGSWAWTAFTFTPRTSPPGPKGGLRSSWASGSLRKIKPLSASGS